MKTKFKVVDHENYKILITNELLTEIAYQDWEKKIISAQNNSTYKITPQQIVKEYTLANKTPMEAFIWLANLQNKI